MDKLTKKDLKDAVHCILFTISQIEEFKNNSITECVLCCNTKNIHIDHYKPQFVDLKTEFLRIETDDNKFIEIS